MSISTTMKDELSTIEKIRLLREKHQPYFDHSQISEALFYPKMAYRPKGKDELYISFWPSELKKGADIYTEFVDRDYNSEDISRSLYRWMYNPHWESEYEKTEPNAAGQIRYLIPVSELHKVRIDYSTLPKNTLETMEGLNEEDAPISDMTIRDFAAIITGRKISSKKWLNDLL